MVHVSFHSPLFLLISMYLPDQMFFIFVKILQNVTVFTIYIALRKLKQRVFFQKESVAVV